MANRQIKPSGLEIQTLGLLACWVNKLLPKVEVALLPSRRYDAHMYCDEVVAGKAYKICYHPERIKEWTLPIVISGVFHEIGHIKIGWEGTNKNDHRDIMDEYVAERYALDMMKKHYPDCIPPVVKHVKKKMKQAKWRGRFPTHFITYTQIEEYQ